MQKALDRLKSLKIELENTSPLDWNEVDIWGNKALPTIAKNWSEHLDEFKNLLKKPTYPANPRVGRFKPDPDDYKYIFSPEMYRKDQKKWMESEKRNEQQSKSEAAGYRQNCENAYRKILAFLEGIIHEAENSVAVTATVTHASDYVNPQRVNELIEAPTLKEDEIEVNVSRVERNIEFPPEYWEAGTSILFYFNHVLNVKYPNPNEKIKVRIEQEGLMLRMIIDTPTGEREAIEKTLEEYGMVVTGKLRPEVFLDDPFEIMALKNKLEIADLELRQTRKLLEFTRDNSQQRIGSLEEQVNKLHSIIEKGLQSGDHVFEVIRKMSEQDKLTYNLSHAKFGGGFAAEGGHQEGGQLNDYSIQVGANIDEIAKLIQSLKTSIQTFPEEQRVDIGIEIEDLQTDLSDEQRRNPERLGKRVRSLWLTACAIAVGVAGVADFSNNLLELSEKMNVPIPIELIQQNPHILLGS